MGSVSECRQLARIPLKLPSSYQDRESARLMARIGWFAEWQVLEMNTEKADAFTLRPLLASLAFRVVIDCRHDLASADFAAPAIFDHAFQLAFQSL